MLVDSHVHACCHSRLGEVEEYCRRTGVQRICAVSLPVPERINLNPEVLFTKAALRDRCHAVGALDFTPLFFPEAAKGDGLDLSTQVDELRELGFDGLKLFVGKPAFQRRLGLSLTSGPFTEALSRAEVLGLPVLIHVADPPVFWRLDPEQGFGVAGAASTPSTCARAPRPADPVPLPTYEELQAQALAVVERFPRLRVIFPHLLMMAHDLGRLAGILARHPNVYLDLAPGLYFYAELDRQRREALQFFDTFQERILFGSDGFWFPQDLPELPPVDLAENTTRASRLLRFLRTEDELQNPFAPTRVRRPTLRGLGLDGAIVEQVCATSFRRLYGETARSLDTLRCLEYLHRFMARLETIGAPARSIAAVEEQRKCLARAAAGAPGGPRC